MKVTIVDYGLSNIKSVANALRAVGAEVDIACSGDDYDDVGDKLVLPGVGSFDLGITQLAQRGHIAVLEELVLVRKTPLLGICLGMQLLFQGSEEGNLPGLGWLPGRFLRFRPSQPGVNVPLIGWTEVEMAPQATLMSGFGASEDFYFVHSYHLPRTAEADSLGIGLSTYGGIKFISAAARDNICAVQFHPEKSQATGLKLLSNFVNCGR